jgi:putative membrane protein
VVVIVFGIFTITWLLEHYPEPLWGFFFGLVMASAILISRHVTHWDLKKVVALIVGTAIAVFIATVSPTEGSTHPLYIFVAGMIAISAFILPGISGSFMLLLMGMYTLIIPSLKSIILNQDLESLYIISIFAVGCIVGITTFSRVLSWLFHHYRATTFVLLTGFLIGSLYKIWPWRNLNVIVDKSTGVQTSVTSLDQLQSFDMEKMKILSETNVLPMDYWMSSPKTIITIVSVIIGFFVVLWIEKNSKPEVLED